MGRLDPAKLRVVFVAGAASDRFTLPRCYTLTHSDRTGDLYLTVGSDYDRRQVSNWYTRLMRDEVLAEWRADNATHALHVHCHVSGGFVIGSARWRDRILQREIPLVLEAIRFGERLLLDREPALESAPVKVHFHSSRAEFDRTEDWGALSAYR